jgi:hypothetical protein
VLVFRSQGSVHCLSAAFAILVSTCSVEDLQSFPLTITKARHDLRCQDRKIGREMRRRPNPDACYLQAVCHAWTNLQIRDLSAPTRQPPHGHTLQISMSNPRRIPAAMETYGDACGKTLNYRSTLSCSHCTPMPVVILTAGCGWEKALQYTCPYHKFHNRHMHAPLQNMSCVLHG